MMRDLYADASTYGRLFPLDADEVGFWKALVAGGSAGKLLVDAGAGPSALGTLIGSGNAVAIDPCRELLVSSPVTWRVQGDALAMPLQPNCAGAVVSRLFGLAYAVAADPERRLPALAAEIQRVLTPGGVTAIEIPLANCPRKLQWIEETAEIAPEMIYRFRYLDLAAEYAMGAVLNTQIIVEGSEGRWELETPLFVFTPDGARQWGALAGLESLRFYASYDVTTETLVPPEDALRGVLCGHMRQAADRGTGK